MANWDNKKLLLNYIRHSFIIGDDTGVCESVLKPPSVVERPGWIDENLKEQQSSTKVENNLDDGDFSDEDDEFSAYNDFMAPSPDIKIEFGRRTKSEVSKRLESLRQQRNNRSKISMVTCKNAKKTTMTVPESNERTNFEFNVSPNREVDNLSKPKSSLVSQIIDFSRNCAVNPFQQYSQYDAQGTAGGKQLYVFLHSHSEFDVARLHICISTNAKVRDLIGLVCFHYTKKDYKPDLRSDVRYYDLRVAEDDGQVDSALPPRSPAENVSRFHFPIMALVEKNLASTLTVNVHTVTGQVYTFPVDQDDCLITIRDMALEKFRSSQRISAATFMDIQYQLEKLDECGTGLSLDKPISWARTKDFFLIRQNSVRPDAPKPDFSTIASEAALDSILSFIILQSYQLSMIRKSSEVSVIFELQQDLIEIRGAKMTNMWRNFRRSFGGGEMSFILRIPYVQVTNVKVEDENDQAMLYVSFLKSDKTPRQKMKRFRGRSFDLNELAKNLKKNIKLGASSGYKKTHRNISMTWSVDAVSTKTVNFSPIEISAIFDGGAGDVDASIHSKRSLFRRFQSAMTSFRSNR